MLKCENPRNEGRAIQAFRAWSGSYPDAACVFEHGQLWVVDGDSGGQWSVVDATGGDSCDGFGFECVTEPDVSR